MKSRRNVWELQHQTICKVIGMAFDLGDLKKIRRKFDISLRDSLLDDHFALHSTIVHLCGTDNRVARYVQKIIETRFDRYARRVSSVEVRELIEGITEEKGDPRIPLWAILWSLATRGLENAASLETALFGFIHMLEHRLVRDFWETSAKRAAEREQSEKAVSESTMLRREILELRSRLERAETRNAHLHTQLSALLPAHPRDVGSGQAQVHVPPQKVDQGEKTMRFQMLLDDARARIQSLEQERSRLLKEIDVLTHEVSWKNREGLGETHEVAPLKCPFQECLRQKHVAMVGGINSLECHYRQLVEAMGGTFQRHDGDCRGGECLIQDCVRKADLVVCPVEVNSHNAVKSVKKLCKSYGVPCCFPRTAGLSGFRMAIEQHFSEPQVA